VSLFSVDQTMTLLEILLIVAGIAITWAVFYNSENAELPGDATIPDPGEPDDMMPDVRGRTLS